MDGGVGGIYRLSTPSERGWEECWTAEHSKKRKQCETEQQDLAVLNDERYGSVLGKNKDSGGGQAAKYEGGNRKASNKKLSVKSVSSDIFRGWDVGGRKGQWQRCLEIEEESQAESNGQRSFVRNRIF